MITSRNAWTFESGDVAPVNGGPIRIGDIQGDPDFVTVQLIGAGATVEIQITLDDPAVEANWTLAETLSDFLTATSLYLSRAAHVRARFTAGADGDKVVIR